MADTAWTGEILDLCAAGEGEKFAALFAEDGYLDDVGAGYRADGREAISKYISKMSEFSSDAQFDVESAVSDGELFALQWTLSGTQKSSGKSFRYRAASMGQLREGLIIGWSDYWNPAHLSDR